MPYWTFRADVTASRDCLVGFTVMQDFGNGALLTAEEIDKERGVILSEKVSRDSVQTRLMEQQFAKILPNSLVARRFPIGIEEVIDAALKTPSPIAGVIACAPRRSTSPPLVEIVPVALTVITKAPV